jgi:hypothetical protein
MFSEKPQDFLSRGDFERSDANYLPHISCAYL